MMNKFTPEGLNQTNKEVKEVENIKSPSVVSVKYEAHPLENIADSVAEMLKIAKESREPVTTEWRDYQIIVYPDSTVEGVIEQYVDKFMADNVSLVTSGKITKEKAMEMFMKSDGLSKQVIANKEKKGNSF
jgi:hypothetical protein